MADFAFFGQAPVPLITEEDIQQFSLERFRFAQQSRDGQNDMRSSLQLLESAMGDRKGDLRAIYGASLYQQANAKDDTVW